MPGGLRRNDVVLPLLIAAIATAEVVAYDGNGKWTALAIELVACAILVFRRTWTTVVATAAAVTVMGTWLAGPALEDLATGIIVLIASSYALGRWVSDLRGLVGIFVMAVATLAAYVFVDERSHDVTDVVFVASFLVPPFIMGRVVGRLAGYNELLAREQELVRREAVRDERDRIARELHDVIAHSLSAMVVQVAAAQDLVRRDPDRAATMLDRVAGTGRKAIAETGRLLHVIRDSADELGLAPTPGLRDLDELVREFENNGLVVDLEVDGLAEELPPAVDVSAYRLVREVLTNALRYATDGRVRIEVSSTAAGLTVHARNDASGRTGLGSGLGLLGMTERVHVLGGTLRYGPTPDGRYELVATLPVVREPA
jgi:signal transduction histidine kinase